MEPFLARIRIFILAGLLFCCYSAILIQLWRVQIRSGEKNFNTVARQYVRNIRIPPVRGNIISADGVLLAGNQVSYELVFHLAEMRKPGPSRRTVDHVMKQAEKIAEWIGRKNRLTEEDVRTQMHRYPGLPLTVFSDLNPKEMGKAFEMSSMIPGMEIAANPVRTYPEGKTAGQLLGYVGRDDPQSAEDRNGYYYYIPDTVGRTGLEAKFDEWNFDEKKNPPIQFSDETAPPEIQEKRTLLRGLPGKKLVIVDSSGFVRETLEEPLPPENGKDIVLTLNCRAQKIAEKLLDGLTGAIVVLNAENGDVLAMASSPSYDPSIFVPRISSADYKALTGNPAKPLINRAVREAYSPGSVIKPLVGLTWLVNGGSPEATVLCDGRTEIGASAIRCWIGAPGHGEIDLVHGIVQSCNDYFIERGIALGVDKLESVFRSAGIGRKTGFELLESAGRLPSRKTKSRWNVFDTGLISIGQGEVLVTPLQAACYAAAIANGGTLWRPHILKYVTQNNQVIYRIPPQKNGTLAGTPEMLAVLREGMRQAVTDPSGSAKRAKTPMLELSGKTGTAEVGSGDKKYKNTWFLGFGKAEQTGKTYAIAVLVEHGVSGGKTCAPIAASFFENFLMNEE